MPWFHLMSWTFIVRNTGTVPLSNVGVVTMLLNGFQCPTNALGPGESMTCSGWSNIAPGANMNFATVTGTSPCGLAASDQGFAYYFGEPASLSLSLNILVNGQDASQPPGPKVQAGSILSVTYVVGNTGNVTLNYIRFYSPGYFWISCPRSWLAPGETMHCTRDEPSGMGPHQVTATVTGGVYVRLSPPLGVGTSTTSIGYYVGVAPPGPW